MIKFEDSIFFADFTERPLSCVEREVARGSNKQYFKPDAFWKKELKFGLTDAKKS